MLYGVYGPSISNPFRNSLLLQVTRLQEPWGNCADKKDPLKDEGYLTLKECYLDQVTKYCKY